MEGVTPVWLSMNIGVKTPWFFGKKYVRFQVCDHVDFDDLGTWCVHRLSMDIEHFLRVGCVIPYVMLLMRYSHNG